MKNRLLLFVTVSLLSILICGCGEDQELTKFKREMDDLCSEVAEIDAGINAIDSQSETAKEELLDYLDQLDDSFKKLANISVPDEFSYITDLANDASAYMTEAVSLYHDAFSNNSYNEYTAQYAEAYYERAYVRLSYIITFLHGETPDDENVKILDESSTN